MPQHRMKRFVKYFVYAFVVILLINFGVKAYWKMKSYSFSAYLKDAWTYCHEKGLNEDYCLFVDFSRPSGEDRIALYDFKTQSMVYAVPCAHGNGKGNTAWRPKFSNEEGSHSSVTGHFKVGCKGYSRTVGMLSNLMAWTPVIAMPVSVIYTFTLQNMLA